MKTNLKQIYQRIVPVLAIIMLVAINIPAYAQENTNSNRAASRYITVDGKKMHVVLYGDINQTDTNVSFTNNTKTTLVMLPALGVPSPHIYFKPLAQALDTNFNVVIIEPFGYGLSDLASTTRNVENINNEFNKALESLGINECVLLVHSSSGVNGMEFVFDHPEKIKGFIGIDNTVYDDAMQEELAMEQEYMLAELERFNELRDSFPSVQDFQLAIAEDPESYGIALPEVTGYTYSQSDMDEYYEACSLSCNDNIKDQIMQMNNSLLAIKDQTFPDTLPVLTLISSVNAENVPGWESGHRNQLNLSCSNHELYILQGNHYLWYTNLSGIVKYINEWKVTHQF